MMNRCRIAILFCFVFTACTTARTPTPLAQHTVKVEEGQSILAQVNEGEITIMGGQGNQVRVEGEALFPQQTDYRVESLKDQVQINASYAGNRSTEIPIRLEVYVPNHVKVKVETGFASIIIRDYEGELEVASISGDILIENVIGAIVTRSNRGDIKVLNSTGKISVAGNYGLLTVENVEGDIGVSTIMGTVTLNGLISAGDTVRLETDHGPVAVNLDPDSSLTLQVRSNSGDVACNLPDISSSIRTCDGKLNSGDGTLAIRTVSGAVKVQMLP